MSRDINNKYWDEELETLPREELEKRQLADLQEIVKFAYDNAPYYKRSFDEAGVKPEDIKTLKDIQKFSRIFRNSPLSTRKPSEIPRASVPSSASWRQCPRRTLYLSRPRQVPQAFPP